MQRRAIIGVIAAVLAVVGALLLVQYVRGADARALAGQEPKTVLVVTKDIPIGTAVKNLGASVEAKTLPQTAVVAGAVPDLAQLPQDNVASTTLKAGEQLLAARFVVPGSDEITAQVAVPEGMQTLSVQLEPERVVGSKLKAGDIVGIFLSMKVKDATNPNAEEVAVTNVLAQKVLVVRAQGAVAPSTTTPSPGTTEKAPSNEVVITLAVDGATAERIIFGQEFGNLWLAQQNDKTTTDGTKLITAGNVYNP